MKKISCIKCNKYRKFKNIKIPYFFDKAWVLSIICDKWGKNDEKILKKKNKLRY